MNFDSNFIFQNQIFNSRVFQPAAIWLALICSPVSGTSSYKCIKTRCQFSNDDLNGMDVSSDKIVFGGSDSGKE